MYRNIEDVYAKADRCNNYDCCDELSCCIKYCIKYEILHLREWCA